MPSPATQDSLPLQVSGRLLGLLSKESIGGTEKRSEMEAVESLNPTEGSEKVWTKYVSQRRPVKFLGHLSDPKWRGALWSNEYMRSRAGDAEVRVEVRDNEEVDNREMGRFGRGRETLMTFSAFLEELGRGKDCAHYLTTQDLEYDEEGRPEIVSAPVKQLAGDFPWRPEIMGHLIPQNANVWLGRSTVRTSSGLHHDFHDNLYILLRGRKCFTLYPPECYDAMYTNDSISLVHSNGRINYVGQPPTNADGSDQAAVAALNAAKRLEKADNEDDEEAALEDLLDAEIGDGSEEEEDDYDESDSDEDEDESQVDDFVMAAMKRKLAPALGGDLSSAETTKGKRLRANLEESATSTSKRPSNFSRVDTSLPLSSLRKEFPLFCDSATQARRQEVSLEAGQMLYLPAGWFHEVVSDDGNKTSASAGGHFAFNYWFHPPDKLAEGDFQQPYSSSFWADDWERRGIK